MNYNLAQKKLVGLTIINKLKKPIPSKAYKIYWQFAVERQNIFFKRSESITSPWTKDPLLRKYKFTNVYRASDRVSQYLIKNIIYKGNQSPQETFFRILLFKIFNKISTWELLKSFLDDISYEQFSFDKYNKILSAAVEQNKVLYSGAYIMTSGERVFGFKRKFQNHLKLIDLLMINNVPEKVSNAKSLSDVFSILIGFPTIGTFLAYQYLIDLNYSPLIDFCENEFVVPGPGAKNGIKKCFTNYGDYSEVDIIKMVQDSQNQEFEKLGKKFKSLWGRPLQLIDCQNLFCEVDKYTRVFYPEFNELFGQKRIKQLFAPSSQRIDYWYPPKWGINERIEEHYEH